MALFRMKRHRVRSYFVLTKSMVLSHLPFSRGFDIGEDDQMDLSAIIRRAIEIGDQHGFITFDQIDELVPSSVHRLEPEIIEDLFEALSDRGIDVREA